MPILYLARLLILLVHCQAQTLGFTKVGFVGWLRARGSCPQVVTTCSQHLMVDAKPGEEPRFSLCLCQSGGCSGCKRRIISTRGVVPSSRQFGGTALMGDTAAEPKTRLIELQYTIKRLFATRRAYSTIATTLFDGARCILL